MQLLADVRRVFGREERLATETLLQRLVALEESPWGAMPGRGAGAGKPLDARVLARRLRPYDIRPRVIRIGEETPRGYERSDFADRWARYLPAPPSATSATALASHVALVADVADTPARGLAAVRCSACGARAQLDPASDYGRRRLAEGHLDCGAAWEPVP
jgi:Protein of unknown function (DUF3631)